MAEDYPERLAKKLAQLMQADPDETPVLAAEDEDVDMPEVPQPLVQQSEKQDLLPK